MYLQSKGNPHAQHCLRVGALRSNASQTLVQADAQADEADSGRGQQQRLRNDGGSDIADPSHSGSKHTADIGHKLRESVSNSFSLKNYLLSDSN